MLFIYLFVDHKALWGHVFSSLILLMSACGWWLVLQDRIEYIRLYTFQPAGSDTMHSHCPSSLYPCSSHKLVNSNTKKVLYFRYPTVSGLSMLHNVLVLVISQYKLYTILRKLRYKSKPVNNFVFRGNKTSECLPTFLNQNASHKNVRSLHCWTIIVKLWG